jgi:hypothetical protein
LSDGSKHGFQAKFYTKSSEVDWRAIDNSIEAAFFTHPELTKYYVAIACDLTDVIPSRKGKAGWQYWQEHQNKWELLAEGKGMNVQFIPCTTSALFGALNKPVMIGLREYWFGGIEFSASWFRTQFQRTADALEQRYHPEDHVDVTAGTCFDGLLRNKNWREHLHSALKPLLVSHRFSIPSDAMSETSPILLNSLVARAGWLKDLQKAIDLPVSESFSRDLWITECKSLQKLIDEADRSLRSDKDAVTAVPLKTGSEQTVSTANLNGSALLEHIIWDLFGFCSVLYSLQSRLDSSQVLVDGKRFCIVEGSAATGKSHLTEIAIGQHPVCGLLHAKQLVLDARAISSKGISRLLPELLLAVSLVCREFAESI